MWQESWRNEDDVGNILKAALQATPKNCRKAILLQSPTPLKNFK